jgi:low temperature requirement protein LtrA
MIKHLHSGWAYLVLLVLIIAFVNALIGFLKNKDFKEKDLRLSLFTLIFAHIQLVLGFIMYFVSPFYAHMREIGMGPSMKDSATRLFIVEHPLMMVLAIVLITVGFSKHKKKTTDKAKFKTIAIFYGIALLFVLSKIPWHDWFTKM